MEQNQQNQQNQQANLLKNVCRDYMAGNCSRKSCKFIHNPNLCIHFYNGNCKHGDKCKYLHDPESKVLINTNEKKIKKSDKYNKNNKNNKLKSPRKIINTESVTPNYSPPEMRVQFEYGKSKCELSIQSNDVLMVPDLFNSPSDSDIYDRLLKEVYATKFDKNKLIHEWHEGCHLIVDDHFDWKKDCPTFNYVIDKIKKYFNMDIKATRFNIMEDLQDHKFFHYDGAAIKPDIAKIQNFTIGVSFGFTRDIAFQVANHSDCRNVVSFPLPSGTTYGFSKDVNIDWRHGVPPIRTEPNYKPKPSDGRISNVAWGWVDQVDIKPDNYVKTY
jgi:hypothetical protein